ncbi:MAG: alpha/beta fold hydrolase [Streptosporangiales bacterium]|nr:alpha/beta fold hydrolase [Streptosporangiales bacterium]
MSNNGAPLWRPRYRRREVASEGVTLAVYEAGRVGDPDAPVVVLVHGYPDTHRVWDGVAAELEAGHHVVAYDVRGAGASGVPRAAPGAGDASPYRFELLVADLRAVLDAVAGDRPVHLVGHDWGSIQGWEAVTCGDLDGRLRSYTTISGPCLDHIGHWMRERRRRPGAYPALARQALKSWYIGFFRLKAVSDLAWRAGVVPRVVTVMRGREGVPAEPPVRTADGLHGMRLYRANMSRTRYPRDRYATIPVQALVPVRDAYVSPALLDDLPRWAPGLRRHDLDAGHWVPLTAPGLVAGRIAEFVADVGEGAPGDQASGNPPSRA